MWDCIKCGCRKISHGLSRCPACRTERGMPKTSLGGSTNANAGPGEPGYIDVAAGQAAPEPAADAAGAVQDAPAEPVAGDAVPEVAEPVQAVSGAPEPVTPARAPRSAGGGGGGSAPSADLKVTVT